MALIVTNKDVPRSCDECFLSQLKEETDMGAKITYIVDCEGKIVSSWGRRVNCPIKDVSEYLDSKKTHGRWENDRIEKHSLHVGDCSKCGEKGVIGNFCMWCGSDNRVKEGEKNEID